MPAIRGIAYPLSITNGGLTVATDIDLIKQQIWSCIETVRYERVMQPQYGSTLQVFDGVSNAAIVASQLQSELKSQIRDVDFNVSADYAETGVLSISIGWSVNGTPQPAIVYNLRN